MGVEDSTVTWARTRGSMMKFLPVTLLTASAICVMSLSLKLGVMRGPTGWASPSVAVRRNPSKSDRDIDASPGFEPSILSIIVRTGRLGRHLHGGFGGRR